MCKRNFLFLLLFVFGSLKTKAQSLQQIYDGLVSDFQKKNFQEVIKTGDSVLSKLTKDKKPQQKVYAFFSYFTGSAYVESGQFEKAGPILIDAVELFRKLDNRSLEFGNACNNLGNLYKQIGQNAKAEPLLVESLQVLKSRYHDFSDALFPPYHNLGQVYSYLGKFSNAESIYLELKNILPPINPTQNIILKFDLASLYADMGQFEKAEAGVNDLLLYAEEKFGNNSREYANAAIAASKYYYTIRDYGKSEEFANKAITILRKFEGVENPDLTGALNNLAYIYYFTGRLVKADSLFTMNMELAEKKFGKEFPLYSNAGNGEAITLIDLGQYDKAISLLNEIIAIQDKLKNISNSNYTSILNNLAIAYLKAGQYDKGEAILIRALQLAEKLYGKDHPEYQNVCFNLADLYWQTNRQQDALNFYQLGMSIIKEQEQQIFSYSSEEEKLGFLKSKAFDKNKYCSFICQTASKEHCGNLYDLNLFSKGILLNSTKQISVDILNSKDTASIQLYANWQSSKKQLAFWYSKPIPERKINVDSLKQIAEQEEKQLVRISTMFHKNQESNSVDWKAIQQQLKPGEAAIEFMASNYFDRTRITDSLFYYALVLKNDSEAPELVPLFEERQLDSLMQIQNGNSRNKVDQFYSNDPGSHSLYDMIWSAIDRKLINIHTVYFSAIGLLFKISFAAIPVNETTLLSDKYKLIQLNSTKELLETAEQKIAPSDSLILYGGIAYDVDSAKLKMLTGQYATTDAAVNPLKLKNGGDQSWNYLPFSKQEVEEINKKGLANHYTVTIISGENATEESLKALNGERSPAVLHIASHGFFFPDPKQRNDDKQVNQNVFKYSANPLLRSGLFFAGAYYTWTKNKSVTGIEDGIATAYEIANMYLPNTKLSVLSACETGLGDLNGSDGVLGLQRAFRMAGVKNLVMSLWKVPDTETAEFMTIFYENIFRQQTISDAFYTAQTVMKNKYREDPYKWAAFILVR